MTNNNRTPPDPIESPLIGILSIGLLMMCIFGLPISMAAGGATGLIITGSITLVLTVAWLAQHTNILVLLAMLLHKLDKNKKPAGAGTPTSKRNKDRL
ncbi:hypothetical protein LJC61_02600 [Ruminococcaceae bacterium OttesenSCG-928-A16]|nr:hypothetical protein [Ruminococcaceae bacterium OttesenSCG-928-A16]